jgi:hypothetical protein
VPIIQVRAALSLKRAYGADKMREEEKLSKGAPNLRMMMPSRERWIVVLACGWSAVMSIDGSAWADPQLRGAAKEIRRQAMVFVLAKGDPGACGPGCSEWIAAEGSFDHEAHLRLRQLLGSSPRRPPPIFFHSTGGFLSASMAVGSVLRQHHMQAGVGHTIPAGCRDALKFDEACHKLMQSSGQLRARLRFNGAVCASACAYALIGASSRSVAQQARVGVHEPRPLPPSSFASLGIEVKAAASRTEVTDVKKRYATQMGVDAGVVDIAERTKRPSMHWLSRDEITRLGIATTGHFETPWVGYSRPGVGYYVGKSVTQPSRSHPAEFRTTMLEFGCTSALGIATLSVVRELDGLEASAITTVQVTAGDSVIYKSNSGSSISVRSCRSLKSHRRSQPAKSSWWSSPKHCMRWCFRRGGFPKHTSAYPKPA